MSDHSPELLCRSTICLFDIGNNVHQRDTLKALHLLEVDVTGFVAVDLADSEDIVGSVRVGLDDRSVFLVEPVVHGDVQEDRVRAGIEDSVG